MVWSVVVVLLSLSVVVSCPCVVIVSVFAGVMSVISSVGECELLWVSTGGCCLCGVACAVSG